MRLTLMRHALAAVHGPWSDADRPLTAEGEDQALEAARGLATLQLGVQSIHCSPAQRCRQTAAIVAHALGIVESDIEVQEDLSLGTSLPRTVERLQQETHDSVLWIGHQPILERLASWLLLEEGTLPLQLLPAACLGLHCRFRDGQPLASILWFMRSHELALLRQPTDDG